MEAAYAFFKAIANYSMYEEHPDFSSNPILYAIWNVIEREIDLSVGRRKRNFANDEMDKNIQTVKRAIIKNPKASVREIAEMTGVGKSTVDRIKHKYKSEIEATNSCSSVNESDYDSGIDPDAVNSSDSFSDTGYDSGYDTDYYNGNDTMGRDRDRPTRQLKNNCHFLDEMDDGDGELPF